MDTVALNVDGKITWEKPTGRLRFVSGRLQQRWVIYGSEVSFEWRDVPIFASVEEADKCV